ncbi:hypothetical protein QBZ16_001975 [Prototheca wickerhamii]|uniref:Uncharacterized protein n=1 Tax=Prototheca wickerhamii TaxID=3111 RepID=A0AAD9IMT3_PROWI|nr:hypothetical protein QBZ16_001975 [Prototheca wickerhamii]
MDHDQLVILAYVLAVVLLVAFFLYACVYSHILRRKNQSVEEFITARGQMSTFRITMGFYAAAVGAWAVVSPPSYSPYAGVIGCVMYAIATGLPIIMIAFAGGKIQEKVPHVLSLTDFVGWRYGYVAQSYVVVFVCFNMGIALLAEYTTVGSLFGSYLGVKSFPIIIVVGVLTMVYTAYGGLLVSILTDFIQGGLSIVLVAVLAIYVAARFRYPLPTPLTCDPEGFCLSGTNATGWGSIFSMPASLITSTVFSEAMWQRVWASESRRSLRRASFFAFAAVTLVVFFTGFLGLLGAWSGQLTFDTPTNLFIFTALPGSMDAAGQIANGIGVVTMLLTVTMNESAIDSMQNGLAAAISTHFLRGFRLRWTRLVVLLINVPVMVVATKGYSVLELFLLANILCSTTALPLLAGLIERLHPVYGGGAFIFSSIFTMFLTSVYGISFQWNDALSSAKNISNGMHYTFIGNNYDYRVFLMSIGCSIGMVMVTSAINYALQRWVLRSKPALMGFVAPATHEEAVKEEDSEPKDEWTKEKQVSALPMETEVEHKHVL